MNISKDCADFLRSELAARTGTILKSSHAHELVAAFFGYKSRAALLAEQEYPLDRLCDAAVFVPDVPLIEKRRSCLSGLPLSVPSSRELASVISEHLARQQYFSGEIWLYETLESYVTEVLLPDEDAYISDCVAGVMAETNASFMEPAYYEPADVTDDGDRFTVEVTGQIYGSADMERPFCGDQIDINVTIELPRVAGRVGFGEPDISVRGEVNDDWVDPELKYAAPLPPVPADDLDEVSF
jgi:hypothetical protein